MADFNCPSCAAPVPSKLGYSKLIVCEYCQSMIFLEDQQVASVGEKSVLNDAPSLLKLNSPFRYRKNDYTPVGHIQFDYGGGLWDEWWVIGDEGGCWLSVDEGDYALEKPVDLDSSLPDPATLQTGQELQVGTTSYVVTEVNDSTCVGVAGELPEVIRPGESHHYAHLSGALGAMMTLESFDDGGTLRQKAFRGRWIDPFDIEAFAG